MAHLKLVTVKANGRQYMYLNENKGKVHVRGEVLAVGGFSTNHGDAKTFLADRVTIREVDLTKELLAQLLAQSKRDPVTDKPIPEPAPKVKKVKVKKNKWANKSYDYDGARWELTEYAIKQLAAGGYDYAMDQLGDGLDEQHISDAAMDMAMYHCDLTDAGVPEGLHVIRECAADCIHEGMLKAIKQCKSQGRSVKARGNV